MRRSNRYTGNIKCKGEDPYTSYYIGERGADMKGIHFLILAVVLVIVDVLVPFLVLKDIAGFGASYLFWTILTFLVILFGIVYTGKWRRGQ